MSLSFHVVIATAGRPDLLGRTLASLAACTKPDGYRGTLVIENGPVLGVEETVRMVASELNARYLHVVQPNKSAALNVALAELREGLVVFFDDDVRIHPAALAAYARTAAGFEGGAYFGGACRAEYERPPPPHLVPYLPVSARGLDPRRAPTGHFMGFNWAAFAAELHEIGGFDPRFGPGSPTGATTGDETVVQLELRKRGAVPVPVSDAVVWHHVPAECCTEQWTLRRGFREGLAHAQLDASDRPFGGGGRAVASLATNALRYIWAQATHDPGLRVAALSAVCCRAGFLVGLLRASRRTLRL